jgi:DNA-binding transcriptional ArsR family regulator
MNAMVEPQAFQLPKKPRIKEKDAPPDQRKVAVLPFKAVFDERLTPGALQVLAAVCAYCNRAGITWVSQARLATELKITRQAVTNQLARLRAAGYVEIMKKGYPGQRCNTLRVIFDPTVDAETAMAVTSRYEDTRPPAIKEEQERQMYEQPDPEGQQRIAQLIAKAFKNPNPKQERTMPKSGETRAVREVKEAMAKAKSKSTKAVDKPVDQGSPLDTPECPIDRKPAVSSRASIGHSTVSSEETPECPITRQEHIRDKDIKVKGKDKVKDKHSVLGNLDVVDFDFLIDSKMTPEQIEEYASTLLPLFAAEGLTPSSKVLADSILQMRRDLR